MSDELQKCSKGCPKIGFKSRRDLDIIWRELGDGAKIGRPGSSDGTDGTDGPCKLRAIQTEASSTVGDVWARRAKIGRWFIIKIGDLI